MNIEAFEPGNIIFAAQEIANDGSLPDVDEGVVLATEGQRGVIINTGHLEEQPNKHLVLVRFETPGVPGELGPAIACWPEELALPKEE